MEDYEDFFKTVCRVCLSYTSSGNMVSLTDNSTKSGLSCYGEAVLIFTNISIKNDSLPNKMCGKCLHLLKQAIIFRRTCETTNAKLSKFMKKVSFGNSDFKEKLCDFVLFMNHFSNDSLTETSKKRVKQKKVKHVDSLTKQSRETKVNFVKNENSIEIDYGNDGLMDFDDLFTHDFKEDSNIDPKLEYDADYLLNNMEMVAELKPQELQMYQKKYPKNKKQLHSKTLYKQKNKNEILHDVQEKPKRKKEQITEDDLQCKICMKILANPDSYQAHVQRHTGGQYICEQCGRKFVTNGELKYHLASTHDIGAQYICKECGFKAPKKYELMEHERIHTGERPYACDKCGLTFRRRYIWKKHALYHMEKTIQCQQCPRKFYVKGELIAHVNGVHERMYVYACSHCDVTYAKTGTVRRHMTEKHGIAREMQGKIMRINYGKTSAVWNLGKGRPSISQTT